MPPSVGRVAHRDTGTVAGVTGEEDEDDEDDDENEAG
jgi:hypothetical protein